MFHIIYSPKKSGRSVISIASSAHTKPPFPSPDSQEPGQVHHMQRAYHRCTTPRHSDHVRLIPPPGPSCRSPRRPHLPTSRQARQIGAAYGRAKTAGLVGHAVAGIRGKGCTESILSCIGSGVWENPDSFQSGWTHGILGVEISVRGRREAAAKEFWTGGTGCGASHWSYGSTHRPHLVHRFLKVRYIRIA